MLIPAKPLPKVVLDAEVGDFVRSVLCMAWLGTGVQLFQDRGGRSALYHLVALLRDYAHSECNLAGERLPAPAPELDIGGVSNEETAWHALNVTHDEVRARWSRNLADNGRLATEDADWLRAFVPDDVWQVVLAAVDDGPAVFAERVDAVQRYDRDRGLSNAQLEMRRRTAKRVARAIIRHAELGSRHPAAAHPLLAGLPQWNIGSPPALSGVKAQRNRTGKSTAKPPAPRNVLRHAIAQLDADIARILGVSDVQDELAALQRLGTHRLLADPHGLGKKLRDRALLVSLSVSASRVLAATEWFDQRHVVGTYEHLDGVSPALLLDPKKTSEIEHIVPVPVGAFLRLECYRTHLRARLAALQYELQATDPFWVGEIRGLAARTRAIQRGQALPPMSVTRWSASGIRHRLREQFGLRPHQLRKAAKVSISSREAEAWLIEHGYPQDSEYARREVIGEAVAARKFENLSAVYRGDTTKEGRAHLNWLGASICWALLTTDLGARHDPDISHYESALRTMRDGPALLEDAREQLSALLSEPVADRAAEHRARERVRDLERELDEAAQTAGRIERYELDSMVTVADDVLESERERRTPGDVRKAFQHGRTSLEERRYRRRRSWAAPPELVGVLWNSPSAVRAAMQTGNPGRRAFWPRNGHPPILVLSERVRVILIDELENLTPEERHALEEIACTDRPRGYERVPHFPKTSSG